MTASPVEDAKIQQAQDFRLRRAFWFSALSGMVTIVLSILLPLLAGSSLPAYTFQVTLGSGLLQLAGAYGIYRHRMGLGLLLFVLSAPLILLFVISQNEGVGILVTIGFMLIFMMFMPQVSAEARVVVRAQVAVLIVAALLILTDLFWPVPRPRVSAELFGITAVIFVILLLFFSYITFRQFPTFGLRGKLISTTLFVAILAVIAVAFGVNSFTRNALTTEVGEQLEAFTQSQANLIGELLFRELTTLQALSLNESLLASIETQNASYRGSDAEIMDEILARDEAWTQADSSDAIITAVLQNKTSDELRQFRATFPENNEVIITDRYGALVAATNPPDRYYHAAEEWWEDAYSIGFGATHFGEPQLNERSGDGFIDISLPLYASESGSGRTLIGILYTSYSLHALADLIAEGQFGDSGQIRMYVDDIELSVDAAQNLTIVREASIPTTVLENQIASEEDFTFIDLDNERNLLSVATINTLNHEPIVDALNWRVGVLQTEAEALSAIQDQQRLNFLLGAVVVLFAAGAAAVVGRQLTEPILRLTAVAELVTAGDLTARAEIKSQDEIGILATAFNSMTMQVRESINMLEERVQSRTRALETSIEVGRRLSTILNSEELVEAVVNQVRDAFNYYHTHIYLLDEDQETLVMAGGTGAAGEALLALGHKLNIGQGLVGRAAISNDVVLVPDVTQVKDWLPNPLLPDTKAEVAVPIALGDELLGVLDVQQNRKNSLTQEDVDVLLSISNQVAIALENARLLARVRKQVETEAQINAIGQQIQATTSIEEAMQIAIRELGRATSAKQTSVRLRASKGRSNGDYY